MTTDNFRLQLVLGHQTFNILKLTGKEMLSDGFHFTIDILNSVPAEHLLLQTATLRLSPERFSTGIITAINAKAQNDNQSKLSLVLEPKISLLKSSYHVRTFLNQSIPDILQHILLAAGYSASQLRFNLNNTYSPNPYILQAPKESDFAFIDRIAAKAGLFFWSDVDEKHQEILCVADNNLSCARLANQISYIAPTGLHPYRNNQTQKGFFSLDGFYQCGPRGITMRDYNEMHPDIPVHTQQFIADSNIPYDLQHTSYGNYATEQAQLEDMIKIAKQHQQTKACQLFGQGNVPELAAGKALHLATDQFFLDISGDYLITQVEHHAEQLIELQGSEITYRNKIILLPLAKTYRNNITINPDLPPIFHAKIESTQNQPLLDEHGRYRLRQCFDHSKTVITQASPPIIRLQPYGGDFNDKENPIGLHTPLLNGAEILTGYLQGDSNRLMILNTIPNAEQCSPVNSINCHQNRLVSSCQHELLFDDTLGAEQIQFFTAQQLNLLKMNHTSGEEQLALITQQGNMNWQAQQTIQIQNDNSALEFIGNEKNINAGQNYQLITQNQDLQQQAGVDYQMIAKQNLLIQSNQNININSQNNLQIFAQQNLTVSSQQQEVQLTINHGHAIVQSAGNINIYGNGHGILKFSQGQAGFQLTADGEINFYGNMINAIADSIIFYGKVNYV